MPEKTEPFHSSMTFGLPRSTDRRFLPSLASSSRMSELGVGSAAIELPSSSSFSFGLLLSEPKAEAGNSGFLSALRKASAMRVASSDEKG